MSDALMIFLGVDTTELDADLLVVQGAMDDTIKAWQEHRRQIMQGIGIVNQMMAIVNKIASQTVDETGRAMLRITQSLLTAVNATVSAMIAVAAGYTSTGILAPVGAAVAAFAAGLSIGQSIAILAAEGEIQNNMRIAQQRINTAASQQMFRGFMGVG